MKKILFLCMTLCLTLGVMTSCDRDKERCYKVDLTTSLSGATTTITFYEWASANEIDYRIAELTKTIQEAMPVVGLKIETKRTLSKEKSEDACEAKNDGSFLDNIFNGDYE